MKSIRHLLIDLGAVLVLAYAAYSHASWAVWTAGIYTGLMLLLKVVSVFGKVRTPRPADAPPEWVYHLLYAAGLAALAWGRLYGLAAAWAVLWVLDWYGARQRG